MILVNILFHRMFQFEPQARLVKHVDKSGSPMKLLSVSNSNSIPTFKLSLPSEQHCGVFLKIGITQMIPPRRSLQNKQKNNKQYAFHSIHLLIFQHPMKPPKMLPLLFKKKSLNYIHLVMVHLYYKFMTSAFFKAYVLI